MKTYLATAAVLVAFWPASYVVAGDGTTASPAAGLVEKALAADLRADTAERDRLLSEALRVDPDNELAHWLLGEVKFQGVWRSVENVGNLVAHDPRWKVYQQRLATTDDSVDSQAALARWCRSERLENEARWHWFQVLRADPDNREAMGNLDVQRYRGGYYTSEQIKQFKSARAQAEQEFKRYRREFKTLVSSAERVQGEDRKKLLAKLSAVRNPAAIGALMNTLVDASGDERKDGFGEQVCLAIVAALSEMPEHEATLKLVEISIYAPHPAVRQGAAEGLRYREPTDFMPILMASLAAPVESSFSIQVLPSGHVTLVEELYEEGPASAQSHVRSTNYLTQNTVRQFEARFDPASGKELPPKVTFRVVAQPQRDFNRAANRVATTNASVESENAARSSRNRRIQQVLEIATDQQLGEDPKAWWTAWQQYNDLYTPEELPVQESFNQEINRLVNYGMPMSCFVAGTPVWTQSGPKAIEQIVVGEFVLSQDPISGQLDYRPIIGTTIRPPTGTVELAVGDEKIVATRGHRFWVTGEGWRMAKFLHSGARVVAAGGSAEVAAVQEGEDETAYNLVVGDFHTYFVGNSRLLVHDNNCPVPTTAGVPGVAR